MRNVLDCINAFIPLLSTEYELVLGRKGVSVTLRISFDKKDCFHLMGLQYLVDRPELSRDRGRVFDEIADGTITIEKIESSDFYNTVFKYNKKANMYSMIEADYLMENNVESRNLFLFLSNDEGDNYFCRSFFPEEKMDYSKNQASWTLLYKKKIDLSTRIETVLYNRIK